MDGRISRNKSKQVDEKTVKRNGRNVDGWTGKRISKQQVVEGKAKNGRWEGQVKKMADRFKKGQAKKIADRCMEGQAK